MTTTINASLFQSVREHDFGRLGDRLQHSVLDWGYILNSRVPQDQKGLFEWRGSHDLLHWISGRLKDIDKPPDAPPKQTGYWERPRLAYIDGLVQKSAECFEALLSEFEGLDRTLYDHSQIDLRNAQDFHYCASLVPNLGTVLDYGAGYGRQAFLFATQLPGLKLFTVDAVEQTYMLQNWVFTRLGFALWEYLEEYQHASRERILDFIQDDNTSHIVHIPTWRNDLLPRRHFDLAMFVWCLYEMSEDAARYALETCKEVLKPGGYIYIRDNPHQLGHSYDAEQAIEDMGFRLVYYPWKVHEREIHGVPRLYRRVPSREEREGDPARLSADRQARSDLWRREHASPRRKLSKKLREVISLR